MSDADKDAADQDGKQNDKIHAEIKPEFKHRPEQYPAIRDGGDNVDSTPVPRENE